MGRSCESVSDHRETWCRRSGSRPRLPLKPQASGKAPTQSRQPVAPAAAVERRVVLAAEHAHAVAERLFPKVLRGQACQFRSEEHTSELQSLMRTSYAVFCLKKKKTICLLKFRPII